MASSWLEVVWRLAGGWFEASCRFLEVGWRLLGGWSGLGSVGGGLEVGWRLDGGRQELG